MNAPQGPAVAADALLVTVNGAAHQVSAGTSLAQLLELLGHAPTSVATAVNGEFVPRAARVACRLQSGDQISCFQPIVGG
ncbi:sulfur carrier protein ThiS [Caldimonas brevitalea]|uniref:Sulfur carrier protein n=1 Tax=Caldimonas brevitalea TaxID=413882 RepID=A0A0G3BSN5_9BURK|nr:sulfur carrier protein ThiS [Caldimonas brevitalea]AKJ29560.1 sulfur carrier protein [Caldimonas brevitalea]